MLNIYISTSNQYHGCLKPFAYLFNKFWSRQQKVTFVGYDLPDFDLPENFEFVSLGKQRGPSYYGNDFRLFFESLDDEYFIYTMEDQFIYDMVEVDLVHKLSSYVKQKDVGRVCLTNSIFQNHMGKRHEFYLNDSNYELVKYSQDSEFRITCEWTIWDRDYLCGYLLDGMDPWQFERIGSQNSKNDGYNLIGCKNQVPIHHGEAIRRVNTDNGFDFKLVNEDRYLSNDIIVEMKNEGLL
jgi:hypothetical protein